MVSIYGYILLIKWILLKNAYTANKIFLDHYQSIDFYWSYSIQY